MEIRKATLADLPILKELYRKLFAKMGEFSPTYHKEGDPGDYPKNTITADNSDVYVAIIDDKITGFIAAEIKNIMRLEI